ncbi:MAG: double zinc ribbon domain-containing protein [Pyrinomonadaceae bacterium]
MLHKIFNPLLALTYPQACQICENSVENLADGIACRACWRKTKVFNGEETLCQKCGTFLQSKTKNVLTFCHSCDEHYYDMARAAGKYEFALSASVVHLKREPFAAARLQKLFIARFQQLPFQDATKVIPVPLSKKRYFERGFNQAVVLAKILAKSTGIMLDEQSLVRKIHTPMHRAAMDSKAREMSVKNVFDVKRPKLIAGETILLIDDVYTSGATVSNCAKVLKEKGASKVYVLTIAKTL